VYDTWAQELQFRYVRGVAAKVCHATVPLRILNALECAAIACNESQTLSLG
jgi:hypothetical protein